MTKYIVLEWNDSAAAWGVAGTIEAHSPEGAIRQEIESRGDETPSGQFVAVPSRSWRPLAVGVEEKKITRFNPVGSSPEVRRTEPEPETDEERIAPAAPVH